MLAPRLVVAAEFTGYAVLTTDYVFRGVSYSDEHAAGQLGGDVSFDSGIYLGLWGSTIDISNGPDSQRDVEMIYYLGYRLDVSDRWALGANAVAYTYPGASGAFDYDYEEYSLSVNYRDRAWLEYSFSPDLYNTGYSTHNIELFSEWPLPAELMLGAGLGYYDVSALSGDGYAYWQLGITRAFGIVDIDLRYHDTSDWVPIVSTKQRAAARIVLSARLTY